MKTNTETRKPEQIAQDFVNDWLNDTWGMPITIACNRLALGLVTLIHAVQDRTRADYPMRDWEPEYEPDDSYPDGRDFEDVYPPEDDPNLIGHDLEPGEMDGV